MSGRRARDLLFWAACALGFLLIAAPAIGIVVSVLHQAVPNLGKTTFTQTTGEGGIGLRNAILGTLLLLLGVLILAGSIGVGAGIYLAEYATGRTERLLRFFSEILAGMPSIIIGYVGYITLVVGFHWGYSLLAAVIALSVLILPYIVRTTEVALRQVPTFLREASEGLGMRRSTSVWRILLPPALPGIVSGLIVALAISTGELAPLLFTANFSNQDPTFHLFHHSVPYLTNAIYTDLSIPGDQGIAAAAAGVLIVILVVLIALGRAVSRRARRATERMTL